MYSRYPHNQLMMMLLYRYNWKYYPFTHGTYFQTGYTLYTEKIIINCQL